MLFGNYVLKRPNLDNPVGKTREFCVISRKRQAIDVSPVSCQVLDFLAGINLPNIYSNRRSVFGCRLADGQ
jgi:hypothetical protein